MALIAEEVVEEWLNQKGFLTLRGLKIAGRWKRDHTGSNLCE